jgi:hypothetical protein
LEYVIECVFAVEGHIILKGETETYVILRGDTEKSVNMAANIVDQGSINFLNY